MKMGYYSNKNLPRKQAFRIARFKECLVFMFRLFDIYIFWGDEYADMDHNSD
jgi:hypothetical protein